MRFTLVDSAMPPITRGLLRAREIWIDDALRRAARCRRVALLHSVSLGRYGLPRGLPGHFQIPPFFLLIVRNLLSPLASLTTISHDRKKEGGRETTG